SMAKMTDYSLKKAYELAGSNSLSINTFEQPENLSAKEKKIDKIKNGKLYVTLSPCSVTVITLEKINSIPG
ncbi:MAG: hypothetical protein WCP19_09550, partial [Chloroflexota bacterium]